MTETSSVDGPQRVAFVGERKDFSKIVWRGTGLELLTAGFYRFWLATRMRRHLWSHTVIAGDPLEYTGNARELLIGFFFALAVLAPFYLFYFTAGLVAESLTPFASLPLVVAFYLLSLFAAFRARRYRLQRTVWRGVRFGMGGSSFGYMWRAALWGALVSLTLGLALPWREAALERYKMRFTQYGSLQGSFVGTGGDLFKQGWWLWLLALFLVAVVITSVFGALVDRFFAVQLGGWLSGLPLRMLAVVFGLTTPFWWAQFRAIMWRWRIGGMRFADVRLTSDIAAQALLGRYMVVIGWSLLIIGGFSIFIGVGAYVLVKSLGADGVQAFLSSPAGLALTVASYVPIILFYNIVLRMNIVHDIWQRVVQSISITGLDKAASMAALGGDTTAMGEGLSDGLDIGGF